MKTILIEDIIYKVSEKEFKVIKTLESNAKENSNVAGPFNAANHIHENILGDYLDENKSKYKLVGPIDFMFRY